MFVWLTNQCTESASHIWAASHSMLIGNVKGQLPQRYNVHRYNILMRVLEQAVRPQGERHHLVEVPMVLAVRHLPSSNPVSTQFQANSTGSKPLPYRFQPCSNRIAEVPTQFQTSSNTVSIG